MLTSCKLTTGTACSSSRAPLLRCRAPVRSAVRRRALGERPIQNLPETYCDDFQCDSSPAVEQAIRSFARNIEQHSKWSVQIFASDVKYKEERVGKYQGRERYTQNVWNQEALADYTTRVESLDMTARDTVVICWTWSGRLGPVPAAASVTSTVTLNVLTGKVLTHTDDVRITSSPPSAAAYFVQKSLWFRGQDVKYLLNRANNNIDSFLNDESDNSVYTPDPMDANKFIQQNDTTFQDGIQYAILITILWALFTAYRSLPGF